jgi:hypothetical protein
MRSTTKATLRCRASRSAVRTLGATVLIAALAGVAVFGATKTTDDERARHSEKATVILELIGFTEWPAATSAASAPVDIGVLGDERFAEAIRRAVAERPPGGRPVRIRSFRNLDEVDPCPILVVGREKARNLPVILEFLVDWPGILTVGDSPDFAARGGVIGLVEMPERIGFEVNRDAARHADLHLSSQLLRLAVRLLPPDPQGDS